MKNQCIQNFRQNKGREITLCVFHARGRKFLELQAILFFLINCAVQIVSL